jgi:hypothetical protein
MRKGSIKLHKLHIFRLHGILYFLNVFALVTISPQRTISDPLSPLQRWQIVQRAVAINIRARLFYYPFDVHKRKTYCRVI